jgi:WD40 repeat protein
MAAAAFFDPARIEAWLRTGASPLGLAGQVGALMASCAIDSSTKNRLEDVRAFLFHNLDMLRPSKWPVKHAVQQLASQEAGTVFGEKYADRDKAAGECRFITLINTREKHLCRSIHRAQSSVYAVCYSPDGSKLAHTEGSEVVVYDASTGFVQKTLCGHR